MTNPSIELLLSDITAFKIGETVYFPANSDKKDIVSGVLFRANGIQYAVTWCDLTERWHSEVEISREKSYADR